MSGAIFHRFIACISAAVFLASVSGAQAFTDSFETPPEQDPREVLGDKVSGPGYGVLAPVRSDGFIRIYSLKTEMRTDEFSGDGLVRLRIKEITAVEALKSLETEQSFVDGLAKAAKRPAEFVGSTVTDPVGTAKTTVTGVGRLFGRITKGVEQAVSGETRSPAELARIISGQDRARRELAVSLGVDPYTTFVPLAAQLDRASAASAAGNLSVGVIMSMIPGGMITNIAGSAESIRSMVVDSTEAELEERTEDALRKSRISEKAIAALRASPNYTPTERAIIAYQLQSMTAVDGLEILVQRAAETKTRAEAYFLLRRIVLIEHYNRTVAGLSQIRTIGDFPIALRRDGVAAIVVPLDYLSWTQESGAAFSGLHDSLTRLPFPPSGVDFRITGDITPLAAERLASFGWDVISNLPMPEGPVF